MSDKIIYTYPIGKRKPMIMTGAKAEFWMHGKFNKKRHELGYCRKCGKVHI